MSSKLIEELKSMILSLDDNRLVAMLVLLRREPKPDDLFACLDFDDTQRAMLSDNPMWMAKVYDHFSLAYGEAVDPVVESEGDTHLEEIGQVFLRLLLPGLPEPLRTFSNLDELPAVDQAACLELRDESDVIAAGETGLRLAARGLRPVVFHLAMKAVAKLIDDLREDGELLIPVGGLVRLYHDSFRSTRSDGVDFSEVATEIALITTLDGPKSSQEERQYRRLDDIPLPRSAWLLSWLMEASLSKPLLFPGYVAMQSGKDLLLATARRFMNHSDRWTTTLMPRNPRGATEKQVEFRELSPASDVGFEIIKTVDDRSRCGSVASIER